MTSKDALCAKAHPWHVTADEGKRRDLGNLNESPASLAARDSALQAAIERLGAVEVAPRRYAYQNSDGEWLVVTAENLADFEAGYARHRFAKKMPAWWSPERRYAWRYYTTVSPFCMGIATEWDDVPAMATWERITADLETGQEVSA